MSPSPTKPSSLSFTTATIDNLGLFPSNGKCPMPIPDETPLKKRRGKRLAFLREAYSVNQQQQQQQRTANWYDHSQSGILRLVKLSPTSTEVRGLAGLELRMALSYDLIGHACVVLEALHTPGLTRVDLLLNQHESHGRVSLNSDVLSAALLAVGATSSNHSAIVGYMTNPHTHTASPDELLALGLGRRRNGAVRVLVARSLAIARDSAVLESTDVQAGPICELLAMLALHSSKADPFLVEIRDSLRARAHQAADRTSLGDRKVAQNALVACDAMVGLVFNTKLTVADGEFEWSGMKEVETGAARRRLELVRATSGEVDQSVLQDLTHCGIVLLREIVRLQGVPLDCSLEWLVAKLDAVHAVVNLAFDILCQPARTPPEPSRPKCPYHVFLKMPLLFESALANIAFRHAKARQARAAGDLLIRAKRSFLENFARAVNTLDRIMLPSDPVLVRIFSALDAFPEWDELAIEGALETARGWGPLSGTAWTWIEFEKMHGFQKVSTATFASSHQSERKLKKAWEGRMAEVVEHENRSVLKRLAGDEMLNSTMERLMPPSKGALAERMVDQALVELAV